MSLAVRLRPVNGQKALAEKKLFSDPLASLHSAEKTFEIQRLPLKVSELYRLQSVRQPIRKTPRDLWGGLS